MSALTTTHVERFTVDQRRLGVAKSTTEKRAQVVRAFATHLATKAVHTATAGDVSEWLDALGVTQKTRWSYTEALRAFYGALLRAKVVGSNPAQIAATRPEAFVGLRDADTFRAFELGERRAGLARSTMTSRRNTLRNFARWMAPASIVHVTGADVEAWLDSLDLCARSRYSYLSTLSAFYEHLEDADVVKVNPLRKVKRPRLPENMPRPMSPDDLRIAMRGADPRMRAWLALGAYQGFRCQEIAGIRSEDILANREPAMLVVSAPKGGREAVLPLNPHVERTLRAYGIPARGPVFLTERGRPFAPSSVSRMIGGYLRNVGLRASAHTLRHTFGTEVYGDSHDILVTQQMMRHADPKTTAMYVKFSQPEAVNVVVGLDFGEWTVPVAG